MNAALTPIMPTPSSPAQRLQSQSIPLLRAGVAPAACPLMPCSMGQVGAVLLPRARQALRPQPLHAGRFDLTGGGARRSEGPLRSAQRQGRPIDRARKASVRRSQRGGSC